MKKLLLSVTIAALAAFYSCQKQQTEEERKAEVEHEVQARLAAEHQTQQQQELDQRRVDLDAREKALAEKENTASAPTQVQSTPRFRSDQTGPGTEPRASGSYSMFYTKLTPYGDWIETSDYGYVWHPYEAERSRSWRPYTDGRWVYSDVGWMWVSEEPFGWAAYHYGRWIRLRGIGWVWVPGETWGPAWVSWRKSNDYVGWAPLPPEARFEIRSGIRNWADHYYDIGPEQYSFVPVREFGARRVAPVVVNPEQNINIVNQTVNVTNITYNNTTVVNYGPDYNELQHQTQQPIERLRVERRTNINLESETPQTVVKGEVVEVPAPVISTAQPAAAPPRVKEKIAKVTAERGWERVSDARAAETLRAKIKAESTPPPDAPPKRFVNTEQTLSESAAVTPASEMRKTQVSQEPITPNAPMPHRSQSSQPSATPEETVIATPAARPPRPGRAASSRTRPAMITPPAAAETTASPLELTEPGTRPLRAGRGLVAPTTTPVPSKESTAAPAESVPPPRGGVPKARENAQGRRSAAQQIQAGRGIPAASAETSTPATTSEAPAPATSDREQQKRETKQGKKPRGRELEANESPTPE